MTSGWRPIKTAPRDGTAVLVWSADDGHAVARTGDRLSGSEWLVMLWDDFLWTGGGWETGDKEVASVEPTHWMPLPEPPEPER